MLRPGLQRGSNLVQRLLLVALIAAGAMDNDLGFLYRSGDPLASDVLVFFSSSVRAATEHTDAFPGRIHQPRVVLTVARQALLLKILLAAGIWVSRSPGQPG